MVFYHLQKKIGNKYGKKLVNTEISSAKKISKSKYSKEIKKQEIKFAKTSGKRILKKPCSIDWKFSRKFNSQ